MFPLVQANYEPEYLQAGPQDPELWTRVLVDARLLLTRISSLQLLAQSPPFHAQSALCESDLPSQKPPFAAAFLLCCTTL